MTLLLAPTETDPRAISTAVNQALKGKINSTGAVTLTTTATSTVVANAFASASSVIILFPWTAHAAAELGNGTAYISPSDTIEGASFKITHANNSQADRTFGYAILG